MAEKTVKLTRFEKEALQARKEHIQTVEKPEVEEELALARSQGDLSENADYDAALEKNQSLQNELNLITYQLDNCIIPERCSDPEIVQFGDTVTFKNLVTNKDATYTIGGLPDLSQKKIDCNSIIAASLLNHRINEVVFIKAGRPFKAKILKIVVNK